MNTSAQMQAVLRIISEEDELLSKVGPLIDEGRNKIDWYEVFNMHYSPSNHAALVWAYCIWEGSGALDHDFFKKYPEKKPRKLTKL